MASTPWIWSKVVWSWDGALAHSVFLFFPVKLYSLSFQGCSYLRPCNVIFQLAVEKHNLLKFNVCFSFVDMDAESAENCWLSSGEQGIQELWQLMLEALEHLPFPWFSSSPSAMKLVPVHCPGVCLKWVDSAIGMCLKMSICIIGIIFPTGMLERQAIGRAVRGG